MYTSEADFHKPGIYGGRVRVWAAQHLYVRRDIMLKDGPITTSSKVRSIKFELLKDCLRIGDGDWWGKRRDRAAVESCDMCRRELWRSRDRARPLVQLGRWGNRRRRGWHNTQCWWGGVSPLYYLASCVCLLEPAPSLCEGKKSRLV